MKETLIKKFQVVKKIAIVLVMVITVNCFTGCFTSSMVSLDPRSWLILPFSLALDLVTAPIQLTAWAINRSIEAKRTERGDKIDAIDTFSAAGSLPEAELFSLMHKFGSLPEAELVPYAETITSLSEREISIIEEAFNKLTEEEIASSIFRKTHV